MARLKRKYGENILSPYDKETIVSKSFASYREYNHVIDESSLIEHEINDKFTPIGNKINKSEFKVFLAVEEGTRMLVTVKEIPM